jgi:hypothetical protein
MSNGYGTDTTYIRDSDFLDIRRTACSVLKDLVTGSFAYLVADITPANFEQKLRQLVVGHIQNATQQANKLNCEIILAAAKARNWVFKIWDAPPPQEPA